MTHTEIELSARAKAFEEAARLALTYASGAPARFLPSMHNNNDAELIADALRALAYREVAKLAQIKRANQ